MGQFKRGRLDDLSSTPEYHWHHVLEEETRLNEKCENLAPWQDIFTGKAVLVEKLQCVRVL